MIRFIKIFSDLFTMTYHQPRQQNYVKTTCALIENTDILKWFDIGSLPRKTLLKPKVACGFLPLPSVYSRRQHEGTILTGKNPSLPKQRYSSNIAKPY
jgi:hypothetical protein